MLCLFVDDADKCFHCFISHAFYRNGCSVHDIYHQLLITLPPHHSKPDMQIHHLYAIPLVKTQRQPTSNHVFIMAGHRW